METKNKILSKLSNFLFFLSILFFTIGLNFQDTPPPNGWYQQFLPDINNMPISDIEFLDSLTGFAVTGDGHSGDTNFVIKTTNSGDNWFISYLDFRNFERVIFINYNVGYICGGQNDVIGALYKTTNAGGNWNRLSTPFAKNFDDMSVLNEDTIWLADGNSYNGGVFRTTNGGQNWTQQFNPTNKIYMFNGNIGFISRGAGNGLLYKTTNSGLNWNVIPSENGFVDMYFIDSLTGWKVRSSSVKKTIDGGLSWNIQTRPSGGMLLSSAFFQFSNVNKDTIWGVGGIIRYGPNNERGIVWKTTNGGLNWGYQIPDTNIHIWSYYYIDFANTLNGWAFVPIPNTGIHTITGGNDTTFYTGINQVSNEIPSGFKLHQNYPNPFNPSTKIRFDIHKSEHVKFIVYDILGKEVAVLVNEKLGSGSYEVSWPTPSGNGSGYTSGVYFYSLVTMPDGRQAEKFSETKKMLLIK